MHSGMISYYIISYGEMLIDLLFASIVMTSHTNIRMTYDHSYLLHQP